MRNRWWDRGYTSKNFVVFAIAYAALAALGTAMRLSDAGANAWWWIFPAGLLILSGVTAWRAVQLRARERAERDLTIE
jgi:cytochrome c-type biogenesis protein CcmH/NrfF